MRQVRNQKAPTGMDKRLQISFRQLEKTVRDNQKQWGRRLMLQLDDEEDVAQTTLTYLLPRLATLYFENELAVNGYVYSTFVSRSLDLKRKQKKETVGQTTDEQNPMELIADPRDPVRDLLEQYERPGKNALLRAADNALLGASPCTDRSTELKLVLAAKYHLLDGHSTKAALIAAFPGLRPVEIPAHEQLMLNRANLLRMAFRSIYLGSRMLVWHLLNLKGPYVDSVLVDVLNLAYENAHRLEPCRFCPEFTYMHVAVIGWRYHGGLSDESILSRLADFEGDLTSVYPVILDSIKAEALFASRTDRVREAFSFHVGPEAENLLSTPHVWQRLAFNMWYVDDMPRQLISECLQDAANRCSYCKVNESNLNAWLSGNRLRDRVLRDLQQISPTGQPE